MSRDRRLVSTILSIWVPLMGMNSTLAKWSLPPLSEPWSPVVKMPFESTKKLREVTPQWAEILSIVSSTRAISAPFSSIM